MKMFLDNPIFGSGLGSFIDKYNDMSLVTPDYGNHSLTTHNTLLWIAVEMEL